jgi:hypothetical protein
MTVQRIGFVLDQDRDLPQSGIEAITEGEVDDAVLAPERDGRFGPVLREGIQPLAFAPGKHHRQCVAHDAILTGAI